MHVRFFTTRKLEDRPTGKGKGFWQLPLEVVLFEWFGRLAQRLARLVYTE